jgi:hypothetical protein
MDTWFVSLSGPVIGFNYLDDSRMAIGLLIF